ncbi:SIR2 family protein [Geomonas oryzae]|uniref:SIR2 family protein n=1 Tax=Geomonas oryzae TaxID=2364273 RepID=UPI001FE31952|nr:SIR2 family protein [Geomonas oryzae]
MKKEKKGMPQIEADDFVRRFSLRAGNLMWLLGAGASASAGIPTAGDMIWEFKQQLYISQRRISYQSVADLSNQRIRAQLQNYIDSSGRLPALGAPDEYAALFEAVYPAESDRRAYLDGKMAGAKVSYGHLALATLMQAQHTRVVWTTNFDPLIADACAKVYGGTGPLTTVALDAPDLAAQCIGEGRWPIEVKLHGDFRSRRLKNTGEELRHQDAHLRQVFVDSCRRFGLVVAGYSGRDDSIMDALEEVLQNKGAYPSGLFWLHRGEDPPLPRVEELLARASQVGVEAALVKIQNFDEAMRDLLRLIKNTDTSVLDSFATDRRRWTEAPQPAGRRGWPVLRLNALPVIQIPTTCRRVVCQIGGLVETREAVEKAGVDILVARTRSGVLAFGSDSDVRAAFSGHNISEFDLHAIADKRLRYDSGERGLLRSALICAIGRCRRVDVIRRRSSDLLAPSDPRESVWKPLTRIVGAIHGTVRGVPDLKWREGVGTRLDWAGNRLWLLVEPRTVFDGITEENRAAATDFARERTVKRYNKQLNDLIDFWADLLAGDGGDMRALDVGGGIDAVFRLSSITGFSWRAGA